MYCSVNGLVELHELGSFPIPNVFVRMEKCATGRKKYLFFDVRFQEKTKIVQIWYGLINKIAKY